MTRIAKNGITIPRIKMPQKALSGLKNVFSINSFTFGKQTLGPIITNLLENTGIYLDDPAKARLMAMHPSLKERVASGENIDQILTGQPLELSLFITEDNKLYILGGRQNIQKMQMLAAGISKIKIPEMVQIPAGKFKMGSTEYKDEKPIREVEITKDFAIGKYEVTNEEYLAYLEATDQEISKEVADPAQARHPVVYVSWHEAVSYCEWLSEKTGRKFRLPTEAEWEYVARGTDGRKYPWGNEWDASKVTFDTNGTRPVDAHPEGASPFGVIDLSGNVYEWIADCFALKYDPEDLKDPKGHESGGSPRVQRGGSWIDDSPDVLRSASRSFERRHGDRTYYFGFRVAEDLE
jgi:formylglycine-generating enzyme required for sulfatase activity